MIRRRNVTIRVSRNIFRFRSNNFHIIVKSEMSLSYRKNHFSYFNRYEGSWVINYSLIENVSIWFVLRKIFVKFQSNIEILFMFHNFGKWIINWWKLIINSSPPIQTHFCCIRIVNSVFQEYLIYFFHIIWLFKIFK